jgi:hypothetical protein
MGNTVDNLSDDVLADNFRYLPARSLCCYKCAVTPGDASYPTSINVRSFHRLSSASSMIAGGRAIATSPASPENDPPCPSP